MIQVCQFCQDIKSLHRDLVGTLSMSLNMQPREYFRQKYFEACDILIGELSDHFEQEDVMKPVLCMESILLKSACLETCTSELKSFSGSVFQIDFSIPQLEK